MSFEEILKRRLGPFWHLREAPRPPAAPDPASLYYRRATAVEARIHPDESWADVVLFGEEEDEARLPYDDAMALIGLTGWRPASEISFSPAKLWAAVERDLLFWSRSDPEVSLTGGAGVLAQAAHRPIARRRSMWPTPAVETTTAIAPFPFMPRGRDLAGAELAGLRLDSRERGSSVFGAVITGKPETGKLLRRLIPLLNGQKSGPEIIQALAGSFGERRAEQLLQLLDDLTALELATPRPAEARLRSPSAPQVTWLGHAAVLVQAAGKNVLVDPIFFAGSEPEEPWASAPRFDPRDLPKLDLILCTHGDNDHLNPTSLFQLDPSTPVVIPRVELAPRPWQVDLRGVLRVLGFEDVIELDPWQHLDLGPLRVTACPFVGESWDLELPQATYLIESSELSIFFSADAYQMDETFRALASRDRRVDLAFMGVSGCAESFATPARLGYGNFYKEFVHRVRHNEWVQHCAGPKDALASLSILRPRFATGYAAGGASYIRTQHSDRGDARELARLLAQKSDPTFDTQPFELELGVPRQIS